MTPMTDEEAIKIIRAQRRSANWVSLNPCDNDLPNWELKHKDDKELEVYIDGSFTRKELLAILHFHPNKEE